MACDTAKNRADKTIAVFCSTSWGIGLYHDDEGLMYGYPPRGLSPDKFTPDRQLCTAKEIARWKAARKRGGVP